jgi:hypothetical protein
VAFLALLLIAAGLADLVRGTPESVGAGRAFVAAFFGALPAGVLAAFGGFSVVGTLALTVVLLAVLTLWGLAHPVTPRMARMVLVGVLVVLVVALAVSGSAPELGADLQRWYEQLPFSAAERSTLSRFLVTLGAFIFLVASANRVVRLILTAADAAIHTGEEALKGGRWLGALERLLVAGLVLAGEPTGAAVVIAAKGIIRIPEVARGIPASTPPAATPVPDSRAVTEYFLIGTLSSLLIASALAAMALASG